MRERQIKHSMCVTPGFMKSHTRILVPREDGPVSRLQVHKFDSVLTIGGKDTVNWVVTDELAKGEVISDSRP